MFDEEGVAGCGVEIFSPPRPVCSLWYRCGKTYHTEAALQLFEVDVPSYALIVITGESAEFLLLRQDSTTEHMKRITVKLPNSHRRGGQSSRRFARLHDEAVAVYLNKVSESAKNLYTSHGVLQERGGQPLLGLIVIGPADKKERLRQALPSVLNSPRKLRIGGSYTNYTVHTLTSDGNLESSINIACEEVLFGDHQTTEAVDEMNMVIDLDPDRVVFGRTEVLSTAREFALERVYLSSRMTDKDYREYRDAVPDCTHIIQIPDTAIDKYGGCIGIRWYVA